MRTVTAHHASDVGPLTIILGENIETQSQSPTTGERISLMAFTHLVQYEADAIANALFDHLPLAVSGRIMARMMERHASNLLGGPKK